jgi:cell shape-determining protein MreD
VKNYLILIPIFLLALLQAVFLPVNLLILLVLGRAAFAPARGGVFLIAFFAGLFLDLATLGRLGSASLLFLFFSLLIILYRRRFDPAHPLFLPLFAGLCSWAFRGRPAGIELLVLTLLGFLIGRFNSPRWRL